MNTLEARSGTFRFGEGIPSFFNMAFGVGVFLAVAVILIPDFPALQDYWEWVYQGFLIDQMLFEGAENAPFVFQDHPVPNAFSQVLVAAFVRVMPVAMAAKIVILLYIGLILLIMRSVRKLGPEETTAPAMVVLLCIMLGSQFFNGYTNNIFGNAALLLYFVTVLRRRPLILETLIFSFVIYFCHATSYVVFGMIVVIHVFWRTFRWQHLIALVPTGLMFLWYVAAKEDFVEDGLVLSSLSDWLQYKVYTAAKLGPYHNFFINGFGDLERSPLLFWTGVALNLAFAVFLFVLFLQVFVRNRLAWIKDPAFVSVAILLLAYPFMPTSVSGVVNIGERFLTIAILLMIPLAVQGPMKWTLSQGAAIAAFILPVMVVYGHQVVDNQHRTMVVMDETAVTEDARLSRLFWHRPFSGRARLADIPLIEREGLSSAAPLIFRTSLIAPATPPEDTDAQDGR